MNSSVNANYPLDISIQRALLGIDYIHSRIKKDNADRLEIDDWKYVAMVKTIYVLFKFSLGKKKLNKLKILKVIDRLLLWVFAVSFFGGTFGILLQAPVINIIYFIEN